MTLDELIPYIVYDCVDQSKLKPYLEEDGESIIAYLHRHHLAALSVDLDKVAKYIATYSDPVRRGEWEC